MAVVEAFAGSQAVTNAEHSLTTDSAGPDTETSDGWFQVVLDLSDLVNGDVFDLYGYEKAQAGDTQRRFVNFTFAHLQSIPNWISPPYMLVHGWDFTLIRSAGTDATITWSIRKLDDNVNVATISAAAITAAAVATGAIDADALATDAANEIADALLDRAAGVETGVTPRQWFRLAAAALFGKASGLATTTAIYRNTGDSVDRITATVDADGNRSAVTLDAS